ncbi:hypothetical protein ACFQ8S_06730 [Streptomyces virginiae]|uniref:hypothetical protein n=1 Tax=Streptomyces virginiae TaxID=1961 RepID=UPI0036A5B951
MGASMVVVEWCISGEAGQQTVSCADTAAALILGQFGRLIGHYPAEALIEVMVNVAVPLWAEMTSEGRAALAEGRSWSRDTPGLYVALKPAERA